MKRPSIRQVKALHNLSQGMSKRQALIQAGYSVSSSNQAARVFDKKSMQNLLETYQGLFKEAGITPEFVVSKFSDWFNSENEEIQLKAFDRYEKIMGILGKEDSRRDGLKRRLTVEDFVNGVDTEIEEPV